MEKTIRVTGKGNLKVRPDMIRILITQEDVLENYGAALLESEDKKGNLTSRLMKIGFKKTDLKTLHFNIDTEYESYQTEDKCWRQRLVGYRYVHRMKLEFVEAEGLLEDVLSELAACPGSPTFSIEYTTANPEAAKNELLQKAIEDSKVKAKVLSEAAGVKLGAILTIDYSWGEVDFVTRPMEEEALRCMAAPIGTMGCKLDIEPDDIDVSDTVTVVWRLGE